ncbi:MAG: hypothetical protein AAF630_16470 [Cyanobacteria bacterium P01_C01_bin.38]
MTNTQLILPKYLSNNYQLPFGYSSRKLRLQQSLMGETPKTALLHQLPTTNYQLPITHYQFLKFK